MNEKKPGNPWTKSLLIWVGVLFGLVLFVQMIEGPRAASSQAIPYSEFVRQVDEGTVRRSRPRPTPPATRSSPASSPTAKRSARSPRPTPR